ncbi:unnamed protein product [Colias eurytheme]|nr:unnamed protein product [Colias eurytheme]
MHVMATEWSRMWASASFVGVLIIIGVPLWWKTTEVFRVALPYDKISSFDTDSHFITTELVVLANDERTASDVAARIEKDFEKSDVIKLKITKQVLPEKLRSTLDTVAEETEAVEEISTIVDLKKHNTFYVVQRTPLFEEVWVGSERVAFFRDARAASTLIKALTQWVYEPSALYGARSEAGDRARQVRFPGGKGYHVVLSVVHPEPGKMAVDFDAAAAVEDYIGSFVDELSELHNFTLKSQWLYLLDFDFQPKKIMDNTPLGYHHAIRHDRLHLLMTRLEERAATHVSDLPAINLALYIVPCEIAPVVIYDADNKKVNAPVQAFMSPKWGGVVLGAQECGDKPFVPNVPLVMGTFLAQLRNLIGITDKEAIGGAHLEPLRSVSPRAWEVCSLLRVRALEHVTSAQRSLRSLAKLLGELCPTPPGVPAWEVCSLLRVRALEHVTSAQRSLRSLAKLLGELCPTPPGVPAWEVCSLLRVRALEHVTSAQRSLRSLAKLLGELCPTPPGVPAWEVCSLLRVRALEHVTSAQRSLRSLAKLLGELGPTPPGVPAWEVCSLLRVRALEHVTSAQRSLRSLAKLLGELGPTPPGVPAWEVCSLLRVRALEHVTSAQRSLRSLAKLLGELCPTPPGVPAWEVCSLLRVRALEHVTSAQRSLRSLAKLLGEISNIVINEEVGASINTAVYNIQETKKQMAAGDLSGAYKSARNAFLAAETAFMEPSLLALLYFPDDQKYAIYIPLFLPIMFPVILSLKNLVLWFRGKSIKEKSE